MKFLKADKQTTRRKRRRTRKVTLSKTKEMGQTIDAEHLSELTEEEYEVNFMKSNIKGFILLDIKYLIPFFTRRFTQKEVQDGKIQMTDLTNQWYQAIRAPIQETDEEDEDSEIGGVWFRPGVHVEEENETASRIKLAQQSTLCQNASTPELENCDVAILLF